MPPRVFALDFDGVLCDSAVETAHTAWRAGRQIWSGWTDKEPPQACVERFRRLRPVLETGYEAIPLMHLAVEQDVPEEKIYGTPAFYIKEASAETGCTTQELQDIFAAARDRWINEDFADWIAHHRFYPGVIAALRTALEHDNVYILTTKQERFATALLEEAGLHMPPENMFGLETGEPKETTLIRLLSDSTVNNDVLHFVEDRFPTLERTLHTPELDGIHRHLAVWGYNTEATQRQARDIAEIQLLSLEDFCRMLRAGTTAWSEET